MTKQVLIEDKSPIGLTAYLGKKIRISDGEINKEIILKGLTTKGTKFAERKVICWLKDSSDLLTPVHEETQLWYCLS